MQIIGAYLLRSVSLIHVNMGVAGSFARKRIVILIASFLRIPVVVQIHASSFDIWLQSKSNIQRRRVAQTLNRVQEVLVLGEYWRRVLIDAGVGPDLVKVFVMGVPDFYDASLKKSGGPLKALFAGELGIRKGLDILLEGAAQIDSDKRPKASRMQPLGIE
jgi:glycosyltransferase involved in cell wall biosynthesis